MDGASPPKTAVRAPLAVCVAGAGAVGSALAAILYDMDPASISFLAGGERYRRLQERGIIVNGTAYRIPVTAPEDKSPFADLIIVVVKHHDLDRALADMSNRVGPATIILSLMNGIESEERIGAVYGMERVLYGLVLGIDAVRQGFSVTYSSRGRVFFGEAKNHTPSERVLAVKALFEQAGIAHVVPADMIRTLWWKFMINVGVNQVSAALGATYGLFRTSSEVRDLMEAAMREVMALAGTQGISLTEEDVGEWYKVLYSLDPGGKTSMLQDVEAQRKTEVEMFAGTVMKLGRRHAIPTPVNRYLFRKIREIEGSYLKGR